MKNLLIETQLFEGKINEDSSGRTIEEEVKMFDWLQNF